MRDKQVDRKREAVMAFRSAMEWKGEDNGSLRSMRAKRFYWLLLLRRGWLSVVEPRVPPASASMPPLETAP